MMNAINKFFKKPKWVNRASKEKSPEFAIDERKLRTMLSQLPLDAKPVLVDRVMLSAKDFFDPKVSGRARSDFKSFSLSLFPNLRSLFLFTSMSFLALLMVSVGVSILTSELGLDAYVMANFINALDGGLNIPIYNENFEVNAPSFESQISSVVNGDFIIFN